jgi:hypothetical protein
MDLQNLGLDTTNLLFNGLKRWMLPFNTKKRFVMEWWEFVE